MAEPPEIVIATILRNERGGNGAQTQFATFRDYLVKVGAKVRVATPFLRTKVLVYPVFGIRLLIEPVSRAASLWWFRTWHYRFLRSVLGQLVRSSRNIVVYAQDPLAAEAALAVRAPGQRVVLAMHNPFSEADEWVSHGAIQRGGRMYRSMQARERRTLARVDGLVFVSKSQQEQIYSIYPDAAAVSARVLPGYVDIAPGVDPLPVRDAITVGALEPRKNQRYILDVIAATRDAGHPVTLTIVGFGRSRRVLEQQVEDLGIEALVHFTGNISNEAVVAQLRRHRIYVHASIEESFGLAIAEAMAVGLPIVTGPRGGLAELLADGDEARFWDLDDPDAGAALLVGLLADQAVLAAMAELAAKRFRQTCDVETIAPAVLGFLIGP